MGALPLTHCQLECLEFIRSYMRNNGIPPSFDEMKDGLGLKSKSGVHRLILALEERGCIRRLPDRARAIEIVDTNPAGLPAHLFERVTTVCNAMGVSERQFIENAVRYCLKYPYATAVRHLEEA